MKEDIIYYVKPVTGDAHRVSIVKEVDGEYADNYMSNNIADCNCMGAIHHRTQCKHMLIRIAWENLGRPTGKYFTIGKDRIVRNHKIEGTD